MTFTEEATKQSAFSTIEALALDNTPITLTHSYRGIPLSKFMNVVSVCDGYMVLRSCDSSHFTVTEFSQILLQHPALPKPVQAYVQNASIEPGILLVSDFSFLETDWVDRMEERIQPKAPVYVLLRANRKQFMVTLFDITTSGAAVWMKETFARKADILTGTSVSMEFHLPPAFDINKLRGTIANMDHFSGSLLRVGIQLQPDHRQARQLMSYIHNRRLEIMNEINRAYIRKMEPRRVEDLYF